MTDSGDDILDCMISATGWSDEWTEPVATEHKLCASNSGAMKGEVVRERVIDCLIILGNVPARFGRNKWQQEK